MASQNFPRQVIFAFLLALFFCSTHSAARAQNVPTNANLNPITLRGSTFIAQRGRFGGGDVVPSPGIIPTDITPTRVGEERELLNPGYKFYLMQKLPPRLWFSSVTEVTNRFESNVLFTPRQPRRDYVYRVLPNITVGYNVAPNTSVYANYFLIKDVFARTGFLSNPTFMSLAGGLRHQIPLGTRSNLQADFQVRQLWQARLLRQADILPGLTFTHVFNPKLIGFVNTQLQLRSRNIWATGSFREIDPFYTVGLLGRWRNWSAIATNTLVTNYRFAQAIPSQGNFAVISDFELNRPVNKNFRGLVAFLRAEPIWNFGGRGQPGLSGFDFRIFGGIRLTATKESYYAQYNKLRRQLDEVTKNPSKSKKITAKKNPKRIAQSVNDPNRLPIEMAIDIAHDEGIFDKKRTKPNKEEKNAADNLSTSENTFDMGTFVKVGQPSIRSEKSGVTNVSYSPPVVDADIHTAQESKPAVESQKPVRMFIHM